MSPRVCVIGAGPSGITAAKNCIQYGLDVVIYEKNDKVGGNWVFNSKTGHSSIYENTHLISSKSWSEFEDYPMPEEYPDYPGHYQLQSYFESYAREFRVLDKVKFNHTVDHVSHMENGTWLVEIIDANGVKSSETFEYLMVCNGHHNIPKYPKYPGEYSGRFMHSHDFKGIDESWRDQRVLVIGGGNSACDIAVEAARITKTVDLSMRSPQWFFPKFLFGLPSDVFSSRTAWLPKRIRQHGIKLLVRLVQGPYSNYGLPENTDLPLTNHPTLNSDLMDYIRHGRVNPRKGIKSWNGLTVQFVDGTTADYDIICAATGFWTVFPFFDESFISFKDLKKIPLFRKMMHEKYSNLYFIGLFQPLGCIWPLADYQAKLACLEIIGKYKRPSDIKAAIDQEIAHPHFNFTPGQRHAVEVDYHTFRIELKKELNKAGVDIGKAPGGKRSRYKTSAAI
jgi:hypothetical protein